jgi:hypothetical protein
MNRNINLDKIRERAMLSVNEEDVVEFSEFFADNYEDIIENTDDYIAEGITSMFYIDKEAE